MLDIPNELETALKRGYTLEGKAQVIAEWNYNNIFLVKVTNPPDLSTAIDSKDFFAAKNIANGIKPNSGIYYAFTDEAETDGSIALTERRYYAINDLNEYRYWICPTISNAFAVEDESNGIPETVSYAISSYNRLELDYENYLNMNKVSVTFNLDPNPIDWSIYVWEQVANTWVEIENPSFDPITGKAEIWWNGTDWVQTQQLNENIYQHISKIAVEVRSVDSAERFLKVVEVAGKREIDVTDRTESYSINSSMDSQSYIHPVGRMSSNDGSITFNNDDLKMNHDDPNSDFYGALKGWCQYRTYVDFDLEDFGGVHFKARTGTMYANDWQQTNEYEYEVELFDIFKILQSITAPATLFENTSIAQIVSSILDMVGVDTYQFEFSDFDSTNLVKYFWTDGKEKVFDVLDKLCQSHQAALFVDENGYIRLLTRTDITPIAGENGIWTFNGVKNGFDLPDIVQLKKKYDLQINKVKINYKRREAKVDDIDISEQPLTSKVWESDETIVLRATPLIKAMTADFTNPEAGLNDIWITSSAAEIWPFTGKMNIDGELIEYEGKGYAWWDHTTGTPVYKEDIVKSNDERKVLDRKSYQSFMSSYYDTDGNLVHITGGVSKDPTQQNKYTGRLRPKTRDFDNAGMQKAHSPVQNYGWYTMDFWTTTPRSNFTDKYFTPGRPTYNLNNLKDWVNKTDWGECQARATVNNSVLTIDNTHPTIQDHITHATVCVTDMDDTEFREIGTRLRHRAGTKGKAMILFNLSNAVGYDNTSTPLTEAFYANRCYVVSVQTSEYCDSVDRSINEISVQVKNGNTYTNLPLPTYGQSGKIKIDADKWYDIDIIFRDGVGEIAEGGGVFAGKSAIEVYVDGAYVDMWYTTDNIRPTSLVGVGAKDTSIVDFEYVYGSTTTSKGRIKYKDDELFDAYTETLVAGTNITRYLELPWDGSWMGDAVISLCTYGTAANLQSLEITNVPGTTTRQLMGTNGYLLKPEQRLTFELNDYMQNAGRVKIKYTSTKDINLIVESSRVRNYPYGIDNEPVPPPSAYYDFLKGGYLSTKRDEMFFTPQRYFDRDFLSHSITVPIYLNHFYEDFGAIVHEVRDFDVEYDAAPAKGVNVYLSNDNVRVLSYKYNPVRGYFSLVNVSHRDEIVSGTEELDDSNSIDQSAMLYGYILEEKGDESEEVLDELSIRKYGIISEDLDADWIFTKDEAKALGDWIIKHWGESMDTISMDVFSAIHIQIGDKVNINYINAAIDPTWIYVVTAKEVEFSENGLGVNVTVRRVR